MDERSDAATLEQLIQIVIAALLADRFGLAGDAARRMNPEVLWDLACVAVTTLRRTG
jgi:hypothetical protein